MVLRGRGYTWSEVTNQLKLKASFLCSYREYINEEYLKSQYDLRFSLFQELMARKKLLSEHMLDKNKNINLRVFNELSKLDKQIAEQAVMFNNEVKEGGIEVVFNVK